MSEYEGKSLIGSVESTNIPWDATAIEDFSKKKGLNILLDSQGRTRLPAWHITLRKIDRL